MEIPVFLWIVCISMVTPVSGLNILYLSHPLKGYVNTHLVTIRELISRGHTVSLVIGSKLHEKLHITDNGLEILAYQDSEDEIQMDEVLKELVRHINKGNRLDDFWFGASMIGNLTGLTYGSCESMWKDDKFIANLKSRHFDVAYLNSMLTIPCYELIPYNLSIPFIVETPFIVSWLHRTPNLPSYVPLPIIEATDNMSFLERVKNFIGYIGVQALVTYYADVDTSLLKKYAPGLDSWAELFKAAQLFVIERNHLLEWPQPSMPNVIMLPGVTYGPPKPLPSNIKAIFDASKDGVIYISFGSIVSELSPTFVNRYIEALKEIKGSYSFIFSFNGDATKLTNLPDNLHMLTWAPQNDILGHNKTKVFINHGGHRGQVEALYNAVPMITTGFQTEQMRNGFRVEEHGYGINLDTYTFTPKELAEAIRKILNDPTYQKNIQKASNVFKSNPKHSKELLADSIEHIAKFGGQHLRSHAVDMPLYQFLMVDVLLFLAVILTVHFYVGYRIVCLFIKYVSGKTGSKVKVN